MANSYFCAPQVEDPRIARLIDGRILIGRDLGITTIQVFAICSILVIQSVLFHISFSKFKLILSYVKQQSN